MAEARDFHCSSHVDENLGKKTVPSDHAAVSPCHPETYSSRTPEQTYSSWMSKHHMFGSILQQLHDDHRLSPDPFCALAEFNVLLHKTKKLQNVNCPGKHLTASGQNF